MMILSGISFSLVVVVTLLCPFHLSFPHTQIAYNQGKGKCLVTFLRDVKTFSSRGPAYVNQIHEALQYLKVHIDENS